MRIGRTVGLSHTGRPTMIFREGQVNGRRREFIGGGPCLSRALFPKRRPTRLRPRLGSPALRDGFLSPRLRRRAPRSRRKRILRRPAPGLRVLLLGAPPKTSLRRILRRRLLARTKRTAPLRAYGRAALKVLNGLGITPEGMASLRFARGARPPGVLGRLLLPRGLTAEEGVASARARSAAG